MTSTSDGSQAEEQAKAFARQYAKEFQAEKMIMGGGGAIILALIMNMIQ